MKETTTTIQQVAQDTTPAPTLEQRVVKIKFYLGQIAQNIIEVGKELIAAKEEVPHGEWQNWLQDNFNLSYRMAAKFMQCAERFSNVPTSATLKSSQMVELLALPEAETEQFIEAKAAEGNPVEDMTIKQLREEVKEWKARAEESEKNIGIYAEELSATQIDLESARNANSQIDQDRAKIKADLARVQKELGETSHALYDAQKKLENQEPRIVVKAPEDYESTKQALEHANIQNTRLRQQLADRPVEVQVPADYHDNKRALETANRQLASANSELADVHKNLNAANDEIAHLQHEIDEHATAEDYASIAPKLDTIYALITDVLNSRNVGKVMADYERNNHERYSRLCAKFQDFIDAMKEN